jgi:hypothetical protein
LIVPQRERQSVQKPGFSCVDIVTPSLPCTHAWKATRMHSDWPRSPAGSRPRDPRSLPRPTEQGDIVAVKATRFGAVCQFMGIAADPVGARASGGEGLQQVSGFGERAG